MKKEDIVGICYGYHRDSQKTLPTLYRHQLTGLQMTFHQSTTKKRKALSNEKNRKEDNRYSEANLEYASWSTRFKVPRKPQKLFGPAKPLLLNQFLKTERCIRLKLFV